MLSALKVNRNKLCTSAVVVVSMQLLAYIHMHQSLCTSLCVCVHVHVSVCFSVFSVSKGAKPPEELSQHSNMEIKRQQTIRRKS